MQAFRDILDECGFMDLDFVGFPFTWHKHYPNFTIWERLDRVVATNEWFSMFTGTKVHHLDVTSSDHKHYGLHRSICIATIKNPSALNECG